MARPLGPKPLLIRKAIGDHPDKGNTELAEMLNDAEERMDDKIKVTVKPSRKAQMVCEPPFELSAARHLRAGVPPFAVAG